MQKIMQYTTKIQLAVPGLFEEFSQDFALQKGRSNLHEVQKASWLGIAKNSDYEISSIEMMKSRLKIYL